MNKVANVVYAYSPKNHDELQLTVGDKIEVLEKVEPGWWRGKLREEVGVFPSNFVQLVETNSPPSAQTVLSSHNSNQQNRSGLFGSRNSKTSLSSNSLNSNNSNSNHNINNNINSTDTNGKSDLNPMMNNTQHAETPGLAPGEELAIGSSERRPKPIRGPGFGDIFAAASGLSKPLPGSPGVGVASERFTTSSLGNSMQKPIPKKPPPPAPVSDVASNSSSTTTTSSTNGTSGLQAPALPPKPSSHFSPHMRPLPPTHPVPQQHQSLPQPLLHHQQVRKREQARVIYAYEPNNDDELAMEVGDIIDVLDKEIEDAGWWRGELRGKIGVFPDNFVQLIEVPETKATPMSNAQEWPNNRLPIVGSHSVTPAAIQTSIEGKVKSVFAATPKGFSKELESNLEKHSNSANSFMSIKRNKIQQNMQPSQAGESTSNGSSPKRDEPANAHEADSPTKLNHLTANRAKGPNRRPPTNFLGKRNQIDSLNSNRRDSNGRQDSASTVGSNANAGLPSSIISTITSTTGANSTPNATIDSNINSCLESPPENQESLCSLPPGGIKIEPNLTSLPPKVSEKTSEPNINSITSDEAIRATPKTTYRANPLTGPADKTKTTDSRPSWMIELKKAQSEKKRDTPLVADPQPDEEVSPVKTPVLTYTPNNFGSQANNFTPIQSTNSKNVTSEISELREEVKKMREELKGMKELKESVEAMKIELKVCLSATENQKKYIKDLVTNLADERKKIAAMQTEIERNLK